jgi:hypothetical protein
MPTVESRITMPMPNRMDITVSAFESMAVDFVPMNLLSMA